MKLKGYLAAALAAATYGTNPAFAVPLYDEGMNVISVLLFRYLLGLPLLAVLALWRGRSLFPQPGDLWPALVLGLLMSLSSLTLFAAYNYMNSGVASTLLFVYPVMVALIMSLFFHESFRPATGLCLLVMGVGLWLLAGSGDSGNPSSITGFVLVMLSSLSYAVYLVLVNVWHAAARIPTVRLLFYVLVTGSMLFACCLAAGQPLTLPAQPVHWLNLIGLALVPTVLSLMLTTVAIQNIGSTATSIFGALEPVTAVVLSVCVLNQSFSLSDMAGATLILIATTAVVVSDKVDTVLLRARRLFPSLRHRRHNTRF